MNPDQAALFRAKLHVRGGKRRISQGKIAAGISALHDAIISAMYSIFFSLQFKESTNHEDYNIYTKDDLILFLILKRSRIIEETFREEDFVYLLSISDQALDGQIAEFDLDYYLEKYDNLMKQLGVLPFPENELLPENPATY
ncbi:MAG: hypothetical protein ACXACK_17795 [Candidatus Hodarchaeales archaeon]